MEAFDFKPNGNFCISYKSFDPDSPAVKEAVTLFYISIGSMATITQTVIKDTHDYLRFCGKDYYKHGVKLYIKQANERIDKMISVFKKYTSEANGYKMWLDITDEMEENLSSDIKKAYYSFANYLSKNSTGWDYRLVAHSVLAYNASVVLNSVTAGYAKNLTEENPDIPSGFNVSSEYLSIASGVTRSMAQLCKTLVPGDDFDGKNIQCFGCQPMLDSLNIILNSLFMDRENILRSCERALDAGGVSYSAVNEDDTESAGNDFRNKGSEWNETQLGVLTAYYKDHSNKVVASMLGRTIYEVSKKAKELGLKKSEKYMKEIRTNNLKKKQNENTKTVRQEQQGQV